MKIKKIVCAAFVVLAFPALMNALEFEYIRIGDVDGFGYGDASAFNGANGSAANADGVGVLATGDLLPDLTGNGVLAWRWDDDFDNRSSEGVSSVGTTSVSVNTTGELFTDIALSQSYDTSSTAGSVWDDNTGTYGAGGAFPMPPAGTLTNQPGFLFEFTIDTFSDQTDPLFINLVFGDYDVSPASLLVTRGDGTTATFALTVQPGNQDGLIQAAYTTLAFADVFTSNGSGWDGYLKVDFVAPNEPYTAFDFVEIGRTRISIVPTPDGGTTVAILGLALAGLVAFRQRFC